MAIIADELSTPSLRPNFSILIGVTGAAGLLSFIYLPWPIAVASTVLALLMTAGADVDARTFLLPDTVTYGAAACGILVAPLLDPIDLWDSLGFALLRASALASLFYLVRWAYGRLRKTEGLGLGDVKLAAAVGAWLPLDAIPLCLGLATTAALVTVLVRARKTPLDTVRLPLGAYLCPALWLVFFVSSLPD